MKWWPLVPYAVLFRLFLLLLYEFIDYKFVECIHSLKCYIAACKRQTVEDFTWNAWKDLVQLARKLQVISYKFSFKPACVNFKWVLSVTYINYSFWLLPEAYTSSHIDSKDYEGLTQILLTDSTQGKFISDIQIKKGFFFVLDIF